jgi:protein-L-isoaspartate(D-aspartate) O-methyltransferase
MRKLAFLLFCLLALSACRRPEPSPTPAPPAAEAPPVAAATDTPAPTTTQPHETATTTAPARTPQQTAAPTHTAASEPEPAHFTDQRMQMVAQTIESRGVQDTDVLRAMRTVRRQEFVPAEYVDAAYADRPLPIGYGQTISQPYIVAWMTELLELEPGAKVLEIGTGSGYQAAVLAELPDVEVYTIEIVPDLAEQAQQRLARLGYTEIQAKQGDGYYGWPEHAPFDAIMVTAAPDHLPQPLAEQLADGGRLVIPIGPPGSYQSLWQFTRAGDSLEARNLGGVAFVPFTGPGIEDAGP